MVNFSTARARGMVNGGGGRGSRVCHINCTIYKQFFLPAPVAATVAAVLLPSLLLLLELGLI